MLYKDLRKDDLRTGMWLVLRDGDMGMVVKDFHRFSCEDSCKRTVVNDNYVIFGHDDIVELEYWDDRLYWNCYDDDNSSDVVEVKVVDAPSDDGIAYYDLLDKSLLKTIWKRNMILDEYNDNSKILLLALKKACEKLEGDEWYFCDGLISYDDWLEKLLVESAYELNMTRSNDLTALELTAHGKALVRNFKLKCGADLMELSKIEGAHVLWDCIYDLESGIGWLLFTYDKYALDTVEQWIEDFGDYTHSFEDLKVTNKEILDYLKRYCIG